MIEREQLQGMFDSIRGKASWSIDDVCKWGYFFTDHRREELARAADELAAMGYRFVAIFETDPESDDPLLLFLHVEKVERHTVDSLFERNAELSSFADAHGLESYDGMDVGPNDDR